MSATHRVVPVTILDGATTSDAIETGGSKLAGIEIPAAFEGTVLTLTAGHKQDGTFYDVYDDANTQYSLTVAASRFIAVDSAALAIASPKFIKLVAGTSQTGDVTMYLHMNS